MANNLHNPTDGQHVVVQGGQCVTAPMESKEAAEREANRRNQIAESGGNPLPENKRAAVKQNLFG